jgi:anti-sigma-K factor RskA
MESEAIHELTAAYALHALDDRESDEFEQHLRHCGRCRDDLVLLREASTSLAYAVPAPAPPVDLRERLLERARADRENVLRFPARRRDRVVPVLAAATAVAAAAAIALGIWAAILDRDLGNERSARGRDAQALAVLASPNSVRVPLSGATGSLAVAPSGRAVLVISGLRRAPKGKTYEAWVIKGTQPAAAGLFRGGKQTVLTLSKSVQRGSTVAVTVERRGGVQKPTRAPILSARLS